MHASRPVLLWIVFAFLFMLSPHGVASTAPLGQEGPTGGVNLFSVSPALVCVGDTFTLEGAAGMDYPEVIQVPGQPIKPVPLPFINLKIEAQTGQVTPPTIYHPGNDLDFKFTYKATAPGVDMITVTLNDGLAVAQHRVEVEEKCDYDVYLTEMMYYSADLDGEHIRTFTTVNGTGILKRNRDEYYTYRGDGRWHFEENILSKPSLCVQYYAPPIIIHGPFDLEGQIDVYHEMLDVKLQFRPNTETFYHGKVTCVDEEGGYGEGWGVISNQGDPSKAAKIETSFPMGGGSHQVEMTGIGMDIVEASGDLDYTAILTLIPR